MLASAIIAPRERGSWIAAGLPYAGAMALAPIVLRSDPERGFVALQEGVDAFATTVFAGERLLVLTNESAPNYALYEVDPEQPARDRWRVVIAERSDRVLDSVHPIAGRLALETE